MFKRKHAAIYAEYIDFSTAKSIHTLGYISLLDTETTLAQVIESYKSLHSDANVRLSVFRISTSPDGSAESLKDFHAYRPCALWTGIGYWVHANENQSFAENVERVWRITEAEGK